MFAALGHHHLVYVDPIPELKRQLAAELVRVMDGWPQANAAAFMRTDPPRVADLRHGRLGRFSVESLVRFLTRMRQHVVFSVMSEDERWRQAAIARTRGAAQSSDVKEP